MKNTDFSRFWREAKAKAVEAGNAYNPNPMTIKSTETGESWYVPDGLCGFAWVNVKPGNSKFANWLKKMGYARPDSYYGGVTIWISDHNQSYERKMEHARVLAESIRSELGIEKVYASGRLD